MLNEGVLRNIVAMVPDSFLSASEATSEEAATKREAYVRFFLERLKHSTVFEEEAARAYQRQL